MCLMNVHVVIFLISTTATFFVLFFLLVPRTCTQQQSLMGWNITLIVIGVLALVVSTVIIITIIVVSCHQISELNMLHPILFIRFTHGWIHWAKTLIPNNKHTLQALMSICMTCDLKPAKEWALFGMYLDTFLKKSTNIMSTQYFKYPLPPCR